MTKHEEVFYKHLKRKLLFTKFNIEVKVPITKLYKERKDILFTFGKDEHLLDDVIIDFVIKRGKRVIAGIEIVDEEDEINMSIGKKTLINSLFLQMNYEYFRIVDLDKLSEAADIIKDKLINLK
ncbi:MAG: hypothetical protein Q4B60_02680 [Erysipelotrichaceae bacterium]|nr:hypothetical protein [Erysipelotrichaceae bacterium]